MKPKTDAVMGNIIRQIRETFPFHLGEEELCSDQCAYGCPKKLLEFMLTEISDWEERLQEGEIPNFRDIQKLSKTSQKIFKILEKNELVGKTAKVNAN